MQAVILSIRKEWVRRYILIEREERYQQPGAAWIAAEKSKAKP